MTSFITMCLATYAVITCHPSNRDLWGAQKLSGVNQVTHVLMFLTRMMRSGHVAHIGEKGNAYRFLVRKPEGKIPVGR
jgi:hypothetical protein